MTLSLDIWRERSVSDAIDGRFESAIRFECDATASFLEFSRDDSSDRSIAEDEFSSFPQGSSGLSYDFPLIRVLVDTSEQ
jgi:hypothetical protein